MNRAKAYRGAVLIEFTIIFPILLLLVLGITELGRALYQKNTLTKAVEVGARYMARVNTEDGVLNEPDDAGAPCGVKDATRWSAAFADAGVLVEDVASPVLPQFDPSTDLHLEAPRAVEVTGVGKECVITMWAETGFNPILGPITIPFINVTFDLTEVRLYAKSEEQYIGE